MGAQACMECGHLGTHAGYCTQVTRAARSAESDAPTLAVLAEVRAERKRQTAKHGDQSHLPDGTGPYVLGGLVADDRHTYAVGLARWAKARTDAAAQRGGDGSVTFEHILTEEWAEAMAESDETALRAELVQVAAVAVQWIEALDTRVIPPVVGNAR